MRHYPQIKICGLTSPDQAAQCAKFGADAIGIIFYEPSPRNVSLQTAAEITSAIKGKAESVGVFVDSHLEKVLDVVEYCGLEMVQLHGNESPEYVKALQEKGIEVIKAVTNIRNLKQDTIRYAESKLLIECGHGVLPGGNGVSWDWSLARQIVPIAPVITSGGINPENIRKAIQLSQPDAIDVSSGVESSPGIKDNEKVKKIIRELRKANLEREPRRIFK